MAIIFGDNSENTINATDSDDVIVARKGNDTVDAGAGDDIVLTGTGDDMVNARTGDDVVRTGKGDDMVEAGVGDDVVWTGKGDDVVDAGDGDDIVLTGKGDDTVIHIESENFDSRDIYIGGSGFDTIRLIVTPATLASAAFEADLATFLSMIDQTGSASGTFDSLGFYFESLEAIDVVIDDRGNQPPSIAFENISAELTENTDTTNPLKVADIVVTDDGLGTNALKLSGADAALFQIVGSELYLKTGANLDFERQAQLDVSVEVDDADIGTTPDATVDLTIAVIDVNEAPIANNDEFFTEERVPIIGNVFAGNLNGEDTDADGDRIVVTEINGDSGAVGEWITLPSGALLLLNEDGTFEYDPKRAFSTLANGESAIDGFSYTISDGGTETDTANVTIRVVGDLDQPPQTGTDSFGVLENRTAIVDRLANDLGDGSNDLIIVAIDGQTVSTGDTVTVGAGALATLNPDGSITYDPNNAYDPDPGVLEFVDFTYDVEDGSGDRATGLIFGEVQGSQPPQDDGRFR